MARWARTPWRWLARAGAATKEAVRLAWQAPTFFQLFAAYMTATTLAGFGLLVALSAGRLAAVDALLLAMSAFANAGLTPVDLSTLPTMAVLVVAVLNIAGSTVLTSLGPVLLRRLYIRRTLPAAALGRFIEYAALGKVLTIVTAFFAVAHVALFSALFGWFLVRPQSGGAVAAASATPALGFAAYLAVSAFENTGLAISPTNLEPLAPYGFPLIVVAAGVLCGMTLYPVLLRGVVKSLVHLSVPGYDRTVYRFLLRYPRRCYTHLFPPAETRWLLLVGIALPLLEFVFFASLEWPSGQAFACVRVGDAHGASRACKHRPTAPGGRCGWAIHRARPAA